MAKRIGRRIASHVAGWALVACGGSEADTPEPVDPVQAADTGAPSDPVQAVDAGAPSDTHEDVAKVKAEPVSAQLRTKLVELAVASECARREEVPVERAVPRLEALFATQGVSFAEYSDAMARLADDPQIQAAIDKKLGGCAALVAALWPPVPVKPDVETPDTVAEVPDVQVAEVPDTHEAGPEDVGAPDAVKPEPKPAGPSWSGTWTGGLSGGSNGNLRVTVSGRTVTGAVATFGRSTLRLKGSLSEKGSLTLGGTQGDEFLRVNGRVERGGQVISGNWDGVIDRKRVSGRFRIAR